VPPILDALFAKVKGKEMIVVFPSAKNSYLGSFYVNSPVTGNWEDHIYREVVGYVDSNYRTIPRASSRGIAGHSMGGFGAVAIGMKHTDVFGAIYSMSPCCLAIEPGQSDPSPVWQMIASYTSRDQLPKDMDVPANLYANLLVAMSAAFAPNPDRKPFFIDPPGEQRNGKWVRNDAAHAKWKTKIPYYLLDRYKNDLLLLRGFSIDYGEKEWFESIRVNTPVFSKALADRNIPHSFEIYAGGTHENKIKDRLGTHVFPFFIERLEFAAGPGR
jgi:S-formylglutathione hydrolase FrmB